MIRISELKLPLESDREDLKNSCAAALRIPPSEIA
jgi:hypothetical protein